MDGKTIFFRGAWNSLMAWPDWPSPSIIIISIRKKKYKHWKQHIDTDFN